MFGGGGVQACEEFPANFQRLASFDYEVCFLPSDENPFVTRPNERRADRDQLQRGFRFEHSKVMGSYRLDVIETQKAPPPRKRAFQR